MSKQFRTQTDNNVKGSNPESIIRHLFWHKLLRYDYPPDINDKDKIVHSQLELIEVDNYKAVFSGAVEEWLKHNDI